MLSTKLRFRIIRRFAIQKSVEHAKSQRVPSDKAAASKLAWASRVANGILGFVSRMQYDRSGNIG